MWAGLPYIDAGAILRFCDSAILRLGVFLWVVYKRNQSPRPPTTRALPAGRAPAMFVFQPICRLDKPAALDLAAATRVGTSTERDAGNGLFAARALPAGLYVEHNGLIKVRIDGVEERGRAVIGGVTLRGCVDALGLELDRQALWQATIDMACMQYREMDAAARTEAMLLVQMDTQLNPEHEWRFPMYVYGEINVATVVAFLLEPATREALNALVLSYKVGPGHLDPCFFVQGMSVAELLWVFAIGAHFEAEKPAVGFHITGELVLAIALVLQNSWVHEEGRGAARVACLSRLVCQANTTRRASGINCGAVASYSGDVVCALGLVLSEAVPAGAELFVAYDRAGLDDEGRYRFAGDVRQTKNGYVWELLQHATCTPGVRRLALAALLHPKMRAVLQATRAWIHTARRKGGLDAGQLATLTQWGLLAR